MITVEIIPDHQGFWISVHCIVLGGWLLIVLIMLIDGNGSDEDVWSKLWC